ncbi:MAG TPA: bifunctional diguanylate cyclase/phosphodiesterase [Acidimicrobiales bacterium]|nr:bifunctional diguanylate cyclase/phosphodiesterase [Acidimicrobiales bacterium]
MRVGALALTLAAISAGTYVTWLRHWTRPVEPVRFSVVVLAAAFAVFEVFVVHFEYRKEVYSTSLSEMALVAGLIFYPSSGLLAARIAGSLVALVAHRRQFSVKLLFNLANFALEATVAIVVYRAVLSSHSALSAAGVVAGFAAVLSANILGVFSVAAAISLFEWRLHKTMVRDVVGVESVAALVTTTVAMLACGVIRAEPGLSWLLVVVAVLACVGFRGYASLRQRYASLERLYGFTRSLGTSIDSGEAMQLLLGKAADLMRAEVSEVTVFDGDRGRALRSSVVDGRLETVATDLDGGTSLELRSAALGSALLAPRLTKDRDFAERLAKRHFKDAVVIPLRHNGEVMGTFLVANRVGHVSTFDAEDMKLFETIGLHASTTLENGRLVDQLRDEAASKEYQSLHDNLTGLPNRTMFHRLVEEAIDECRKRFNLAAVMLMDLDHFKEVNDTLGHRTGDLLLIELSERLRQVVGERGQIARLGGDEFAILVPDVEGQAEAEGVAKLILSALEHPLALSEINLQIGASIGLAIFPKHASDSAALLQLADVAMYQAKANHTGYAVYASQRRQHDARRLALAAELRSAIEQGAITLHYQPKADLGSQQVTGVEALARWEHRRYGLMPPDEFIPIAEHTGLIGMLTDHVLESALRQCKSWRQLGFALNVAVNLSVRSLMDRDLPDRVGAVLAEVGLPAGALTLEITEGTIMADPVRTLEVLHRLAAMGITLSIDDFGTGYSSLSYLKRLPVHEVKIDKSFVHHMVTDDDDQVIVRSVVDLARNLRLTVTAEGVEDAATWDRLVELGCDSIQGNYLRSPLPAAILTNLLTTRGTDVAPWINPVNRSFEADPHSREHVPLLRLIRP